MSKIDHVLWTLGTLAFRGSITAAVALAWVVSALANYTHAAEISHHAPVTIGAALAADIFKALIPMSLAAAWRQRDWAIVAVCVLVWPFCMAYSVKSATGYIAGVLTDYKANRDKDGAATASLASQIATATASIAEMTDSKLYGPPAQRGYWDGEIVKAETKIAALASKMKDEKGTGDADPFSALIVKHSNLSDAQVNLIAILAFLMVLETLSTFGAILIAPLMGNPAPVPAQQAQEEVDEAEPDEPTPVTTMPHLRLVTTKGGKRYVPNAQAMRTRLLHKAQAQEFLDYVRAKHQGTDTLPMTTVQSLYSSWVARTKWTVLKPNLLGQQLLSAGCVKITNPYGRPCYKLPVAVKAA